MHLERISRMCERVGLELGMTATEAETLRNASLLHDVGKIGVPDAILPAAQRAVRRGPRPDAPPHDGRRGAAVGSELGGHARPRAGAGGGGDHANPRGPGPTFRACQS